MLFTPQPGETQVRLLINRLHGAGKNRVVWLDEIYVGEGIGFAQPPAPKTAFHGSRVRVDAWGNLDIWHDNAWQPFFPLCIYADQRRPSWKLYSKQGFNCNI